jgi:hypothetical protein
MEAALLRKAEAGGVGASCISPEYINALVNAAKEPSVGEWAWCVGCALQPDSCCCTVARQPTAPMAVLTDAKPRRHAAARRCSSSRSTTTSSQWQQRKQECEGCAAACGRHPHTAAACGSALVVELAVGGPC